MKKIILFSLIYLILIQCYAQNTWPAPDVQSNIKSKWEFTLRDSLSHNNGYHSNYKFEPLRTLMSKDYLYTKNADLNFDYNGGLVSKIDIVTGDIIWTYGNNILRNDRQESLQNIYLDENENIHITGLRVLKKMNPNFPSWQLSQNLLCNPYERIIDGISGNLVNFKNGRDTSDFRFKRQAPAGFSTVYNLDGGRAVFFNRTYPKTKARLEFYKVNKNYDIIDTMAYDSLTLSSDVITDYFFNIWTTVYHLENNKFIATLSQLDRDESQFPAYVELVWFTIDSNYKVIVERRKDISSYYKFPKYQDGTTTYFTDKNLFIYDAYKENGLANSWLSWIDENGIEKYHTNRLKLGNHIYYNFTNFIVESDSSFLMFASPAMNGSLSSYDLVRVGLSGNIKFMGNFSWEDEFAVRSFEYNKFHKVLIVNGVLCRNNCKDRWVKHLAYDIKDLDHTTAVDEPTLASISTIKLSPNPSDHYIDLHYDNITAASINILNVLGEVVLSQNITNTNYQRINTANLVVGSYILQLTDDKNKIHTEQFVIAR